MIHPQGYQVLIKPLKGKEKVGNVILPDEIAERDQIAAVVAEVVALGPEAYKGANKDGSPKFNTQWCKPGDFVLIGRYSGARYHYMKEEYRLLNDDNILATVDDPENLARATI